MTHGHEVQAITASEPRWYALRVRSRSEFAVRDRLRASNIQEFCPTWGERVVWTDRRTITTRPLFTGYVFARFSPAYACQVYLTRGVVEILGSPDPEPIDDMEIENLQRFAASSAAMEPCPYVAGSVVRVDRGPFAGIEGVVNRTKGATRLFVGMQILGRSVSVEIDAADVAKETLDVHK